MPPVPRCHICDTTGAELSLTEASLCQMTHQPLQVRLGAAVNEIPAEELIRLWDTNGDGELSRMEFRTHVARLDLGASYKEIDVLFELLDNGTGSVRHPYGGVWWDEGKRDVVVRGWGGERREEGGGGWRGGMGYSYGGVGSGEAG